MFLSEPMPRTPRAALALLFGSLLAGCPAGSAGPSPSGTAQKCAHVGQTCEFAPNKLGSCVIRDNCAEDCLVCQSQH